MHAVPADSLYQVALSSLPDTVVLVFDHDLRFQLVAGAGLDTQSLNHYAQPGRTLAETMPLAYGLAFEEAYGAALAGQTQALTFIFMEQEYSIRVCPVYDARGSIIAGMAVSSLVASEVPNSVINRYKALIDQTNDAVFLLDLQGHPLDWNQRAADMLGYDYHELPDLSLADVSPEDEMRNSQGRLGRLAAGEVIPVYERRLLRKDGVVLSTEVNLTLVRDDAGYPLCVQCVVRDITRRKQIEQALHEREALLDGILQSAVSGVMAYKAVRAPDGRIIDFEWLLMNPAAQAIIGRDDLVGKRLAEEVPHVRDDGLFDQYMRVVETGQPLSIEYSHGDGAAQRWFHIVATPVLDGFAVILTDITERKLAEVALRSTEERYRMISELMSDFAYAFRVEPDGELIQEWMTEDSFKRITGYSSDEILGQIERLYHPDDLHKFKISRDLSLRGERSEVECRIFTRAGELRWLHIDRTPVWDDAAGRVVRIYGIAKDITERKESELALRASEERYRLLSELTSDYAYAFRIEADGRHFNEWITGSIFHTTGYTAEELMGQGLSLIHPADHDWVQAGIQRAITERSIDTSEYRILTKDGKIRWIRVARHPIWDEHEQRVVRLYNVAQDITERKEAELALRVSEERYRMISELISDYAFSAAARPDGELELEWITGAYSRITGYPAESILDRGIGLMHPEDRPRVQGEIARALKGEHIERSEYRIITRSGETRWLQVDRHPVWDDTEGRVVRLYNVAQDITRRKEAELALRESEERFRLVASIISDGVYDWDLLHNVNWHSDGYVQVFGETGENVSEIAGWYERIHPEDRVVVVEDQMQAIQSGAENWSQEYRMRTRSGDYVIVADRNHILRDEQGRAVRVVGAVSDITARKSAEHQALDLAVQKEKVNILTDFITAVSHDFRTPLSIINTSAYLLAKTRDPQDWQRHLDKVWEQVEHIEQLVDGLLTMARLDRENVLSFDPLDVNALLTYIEARKRNAFQEKAIDLKLELETDLPPVEGDRQWLHQALINLVDNAIQFTPDGRAVTLRTGHDDHIVRVEIEDHGVGMSAEQMQGIFDPLYRAEAHRPIGKGPGLGLSIARKIIERHRGSIAIDSAIGAGTTVRIFLPVSERTVT